MDNSTMWIVVGIGAIGAYLWYENEQTSASNAATAAATAAVPATVQPTTTQVTQATTSAPTVSTSQITPSAPMNFRQHGRHWNQNPTQNQVGITPAGMQPANTNPVGGTGQAWQRRSLPCAAGQTLTQGTIDTNGNQIYYCVAAGESVAV